MLSTAAARCSVAAAASAASHVTYGPPSWYSKAHGCNRAGGEVWCGGACVLPSAFSSGGGGSSKLTCPPANLASLPAHMVWGSATAAYQIEGAYNEDGRGLSVWDTFSHEVGKTAGGDNGDVADDHYHKWKEDVALAKGLGLTHYRCSLSWSRILPAGAGAVNEAGLEFYDGPFSL
jgi:hypothetical protein